MKTTKHKKEKEKGTNLAMNLARALFFIAYSSSWQDASIGLRFSVAASSNENKYIYSSSQYLLEK